VAAGKVAAQLASGVLPAFIWSGGGGDARGDAEGVQEAVNGERVEITCVDFFLLLKMPGARRTELSGKGVMRSGDVAGESAHKDLRRAEGPMRHTPAVRALD
jgi:hypothetical protein